MIRLLSKMEWSATEPERQLYARHVLFSHGDPKPQKAAPFRLHGPSYARAV
jgi:hypothetical protein